MIPESQTNVTPMPTAELLTRLLETLEMEPQRAPDTALELLRREIERLERAGDGRAPRAGLEPGRSNQTD
jgi:hypothetical protein